MKIIVAINNLGYIGKDGKIPWHVPEDLKYFKRVTLNTVVIMGRKTFESLNCKPLPQRENIIVSTTLDPKDYPSVTVVPSLQRALDESLEGTNRGKRVFVIGGATLYDEALEYADEVLLTHICDNTVGDVKFNMDKLEESFYADSRAILSSQTKTIYVYSYKLKR